MENNDKDLKDKEIQENKQELKLIFEIIRSIILIAFIMLLTGFLITLFKVI